MNEYSVADGPSVCMNVCEWVNADALSGRIRLEKRFTNVGPFTIYKTNNTWSELSPSVDPRASTVELTCPADHHRTFLCVILPCGALSC